MNRVGAALVACKRGVENRLHGARGWGGVDFPMNLQDIVNLRMREQLCPAMRCITEEASPGAGGHDRYRAVKGVRLIVVIGGVELGLRWNGERRDFARPRRRLVSNFWRYLRTSLASVPSPQRSNILMAGT